MHGSASDKSKSTTMKNWAHSFFRPAANEERPRSSEGLRLYAIGDIHGRIDLLTEMLGLISRDNQTRPAVPTQIVMIGDYIDRGSDSAAVCQLMVRLAQQPHVHCLRGNHEQMLLSILAGDYESVRFWLQNGGDAAALSWGIDPALIDLATVDVSSGGAVVDELRAAIPADVQEWLKSLKTTHVVGDYLFVHAGVRPGVSLQDQKTEDMLWIRRSFLECDQPFSHYVIHGHSQSGSPDARENRAGIDTGAYRSGVLTAIGIFGDERWFIQTQSGSSPR